MKMNPIYYLLSKLIYGYRATPTTYSRYLKKRCLFFGEGVYFTNPHKTIIDHDALHFIHIGNYVQILSGVTILAHDESYTVCGPVYKSYPRTQKITYIDDNVFIGMNSIILMGSHIGSNTIIGAGSVVSGLIEPNSVYAGNPARKIMSLEQYYTAHVAKFEISANLFFSNFYARHGRYPNENEQHVYAVLFKGQDIMVGNNKPKSIVDIVNANYPQKYNTIEEFMSISRFNLE